MISRRIAPAATLAPFVRHYWYFEIGEDELPFAQMSFPYGSFELICYLENPNLIRWAGCNSDFFEPSIFYAGQLTRPYLMTFNKKCRCIGASLYPWAGNLLYPASAGDFTNQLVPLDDLGDDARLYDDLLNCAGDDALFHCLEGFLLKKLGNKQPDMLVHHICGLIIGNCGREALTGRLADVGLSRRRVEQRFSQSTGLSMGMFARKVRFQKAVHLMGSQQPNLTSIGLQAGYYDQPHFINEFKAFSGLSPGEFHTTGLTNFMKTLMLVG